MSDEQDPYRKVYPRMWSDRRIMALSRPPPNGQTLWCALLFGEQTGIIPGLFKIGERAFAEQLQWPLHDGESLLEVFTPGLPRSFRGAFSEVANQGLVKADWNSRLVYVRNAIKANPPANPNVILKWAKSWRDLPECELKDEAEHTLRIFLKGISEAFGEAFDKVTGKKPWNQKQKAEAETEGGNKKKLRFKKRAAQTENGVREVTMAEAQALRVSATEAQALFEWWRAEHERFRKSSLPFMPSPAQLQAARFVIGSANCDVQLAKRVVTAFIESDHEWWADRMWALPVLGTQAQYDQALMAASTKKTRAPSSMDERIAAERKREAEQLRLAEASGSEATT